MSFDELYQAVPDEQKNALKTFRESNTPKTLKIKGTDWNYLALGQGEKVILWLVGGLKKADAAFQTIPLLQNEFRIIAPDYPALGSMEDLADGLASILDAENIDSAYVLSGSFGGMLGQVFMRKYPQKVAKLVLSTTTAPDASKVENYQQLLGMADAAPIEMLRELAPKQMFSTIAPTEKEAEFYRAYLQELYGERMKKEDILTTYQALIDFMGREFEALEQDNILIIYSDNDTTFAQEAQEKLFGLYPNARSELLSGAGHSPSSTQREQFFALVRDFFQD